MSDYFEETYGLWYPWFSRIYDLFTRGMFFVANGGFGGKSRIRGLVVEEVDPLPGDRIIDVCSGTGTQTIMLAERLKGRGEVVGLEISRHQLAVAMRKGEREGLSFVRGDARAMPFPPGYFDKGVIFGALHEMPGAVRRQVLLESLRVLKPGGRVVFLEHNLPETRWKALLQGFSERFNPEYRTYRSLVESGLDKEVGSAGFEIVKKDMVLHEFGQLVVARKP